MRLKTIEIKGIWGYRSINANFFNETNIFIGSNGTGKTTFLNFIESALTADLEQLSSLIFDEITILIADNTNKRKLRISKLTNQDSYPYLEYQIGTRKFELPILREYEMRNMGRLHPKSKNEIRCLKEELGKYLNICWLSVHREIQNSEDQEFGHREIKEKNTIDQRLTDLMRRLTIYQLQLESESSKLSNKFREQIFESMLYKEEYDEIILENLQPIDPEVIRKQLNKAYKDLGLTTKETQEKIINHTQKIGLALKKIEKWKSTKEGLFVNDVTPISLLNRTLGMISISMEIEKQKKEIFKPIETYLRILKDFVPEKYFKLDAESSGELEVFNIKGTTEILPLPIRYLSSGEKQLIILLTEALLQRKCDYIFIADEPELSLHISWQKKILGSIRELNENAQIIVATHSPEIAGQWKDYIINMENILSYGE